MKTLFTIAAVLWLINVSAQDYKLVYKVVPIMSEQRFYLNGGARADFGGRSREILQINLPPNTVEWYYAYTSSASQNQTQIIGLVTQLIHLLMPDQGILASAIATIISPTGAGVCDVFLLQDQVSVNNFVTKRGQFTSDPNGSRQNFKDGVVRIKDALRGPYILGIRNPSALGGVNVSIEVAAIVATRVPVVKSSSQDEASLYKELGERAYTNGEYDKCIDYEKKAISLDTTLCAAANKLALACLVSGKPEAVDAYVRAIAMMKQSPFPKRWLGDSIRDMEEAKAKNDNLIDFDLIKGLLVDEYAKH